MERGNEPAAPHVAANKPQRAPGVRGAGGPRRKVSRQEALDRRKLVLGLMANHVGDEEIANQCAAKFGMTKSASKQLIRKCTAALHEESKELLPLLKAKAVNRLHGHIVAARRDGSWNAVASLERLLSDVQGTREPVQLNVNVDATVRESVVTLMSTMPADRLAQLAEQGAALLAERQTGQKPALPPPPRGPQALDAHGEPPPAGG